MIQVDGIFVQGGGGPVFPEFTYTGDYQLIDEGNGNWKIYFLTSGVISMNNTISCDAQLIGGGSGGGAGTTRSGGIGGGSGASIVLPIVLQSGQDYEIQIGSGGAGGSNNGNGANGGNTIAFSNIADGGVQGQYLDIFEFNDSSGIRQSGKGGNGGARNLAGSSGQNAGDLDSSIGGGKGGDPGQNGGNGNKGSHGGLTGTNVSTIGGGGGGGGGYGAGGGGGGYSGSANYCGDGGAGAPGVVILRNARGTAA